MLEERGLAPSERAYVASPLSRTRDTMELLRARLGPGLPPSATDDRLKEMSFGAWEGRTWEDLKRAEPAAVAERRRDCWTFVPPGGESYAMVLARLAPWLASLAEDAVVVAHGGVARALLHGRAGVPSALAPTREIHQGRVLLFEAGEARWF